MKETNTRTEVGTVKATRKYDVVQFDVITDSICEIHACGCSHSKARRSGTETFRHEYAGDSVKGLAHELELSWNSDLAGDNGMTVEEYVADGGGYQAGTAVGSAIRIMPCVKFSKEVK
jgi:hypothetical protein